MKLTGQQNQPDEAVIATLKQGMAFHKENAVEKAVRSYQAVLEAMPSQPDALKPPAQHRCASRCIARPSAPQTAMALR